MLSGFRSALTKEMGLYTISSKYRAAHTADQNSQIQKFSAGYEQPETLTFEMVTVRREVPFHFIVPSVQKGTMTVP